LFETSVANGLELYLRFLPVPVCYIHTYGTQIFLITGIIHELGYILLFSGCEVTRASVSFETCCTDVHDGEILVWNLNIYRKPLVSGYREFHMVKQRVKAV
jgi:hypothetical protein